MRPSMADLRSKGIGSTVDVTRQFFVSIRITHVHHASESSIEGPKLTVRNNRKGLEINSAFSVASACLVKRLVCFKQTVLLSVTQLCGCRLTDASQMQHAHHSTRYTH